MAVRRASLIVCALVLTLGSIGVSQDTKGGPGKPITVKGEPTVLANTIDFSGDLGLAFDSLTGLGLRIEQARNAGDPIGLANAANELAVAEQVARKKTRLTADDLMKEAMETARVRDQSTELKAMSLIVKDDAKAKELADLSEKAATRETAEAKAFKEGEKPRGATNLKVFNYIEVAVSVQVNGQALGIVKPFEERTFTINKKTAAVKLFGRGGKKTWGPSYIEGDYDTFTWNLRE